MEIVEYTPSILYKCIISSSTASYTLFLFNSAMTFWCPSHRRRYQQRPRWCATWTENEEIINQDCGGLLYILSRLFSFPSLFFLFCLFLFQIAIVFALILHFFFFARPPLKKMAVFFFLYINRRSCYHLVILYTSSSLLALE